MILDLAEVPAPTVHADVHLRATAGWSAHILEQKREGRLIRPTAKYVGAPPAALRAPLRTAPARRSPAGDVSWTREPCPANVSSIPRLSATTSIGCTARRGACAARARRPRTWSRRRSPASCESPAAPLRGRSRLSPAGPAQHVLQPAAHGRAATTHDGAARRSGSDRGPERDQPRIGDRHGRAVRGDRRAPDDFRDALIAIDVVGLSYREAARALRVREATITTRLPLPGSGSPDTRP